MAVGLPDVFLYVAAGIAVLSLAIFRRFWAVAASRNSSLAPNGPQAQSAQSQNPLQTREQHLNFFPLFARGPIVLGLGDVARRVSGVFMDGARDLACRFLRAACTDPEGLFLPNHDSENEVAVAQTAVLR